MMEDLIARQNIPDSWAANAHCILCGFNPLKVEHKEQQPDEIKCPRCGLSIMIDQSGRNVCVSCLPKALHGSITIKWMAVSELSDLLKLAYSKKLNPEPSPFTNFNPEDIDSIPVVESPVTPPDPAKESASETMPSDPEKDPLLEELTYKTKALYELGNPSWKIRQILKDSPKYAEDQINVALQNIEAEEKKKANRSLLWIGAVLVVILVLCGLLVGAYKLTTSAYSSNIKDAGKMVQSVSTQVSNIRTENPPVVPQDMQTLVPPGVNIINVPTPYVIQLPTSPSSINFQATSVSTANSGGSTNSGSTKRTLCPQNKKDAAALYGGNENNWTLQQSQWVMLDNNGATITLPQGMSAGYLVVGTGLEIKSVEGPAKIANIYMIMVSCN